ncbi:hypothetical protein Glove_114g101 [Diversispora epigaea]|uniref:Uncharacterized protein n=1 Tax=Diversispora epigaea TaxID=1348612 RepID=A0A397J1G8_9GLOM|nr:hypothetical protein Glove_114g101 [Diversispora epigaea]
MSNPELSQYASKLLDALSDNKKRDHARRRFRDGYKFSSEQVSIMIPSQKNGKSKDINLVVLDQTPAGLIDKNIREKSIEILRYRYKFSEDQVNILLQAHSKFINTLQENKQCENSHCVAASAKTLNIVTSNRTPQGLEEETIEEIAKRFLRDRLSTRDVKAEALAMALSAPNANAVEATKIPEITEEANKIQKNRRKYVEAFERINYPDHFTLESVKERLDAYDIKTLPDLLALADVMIMLCIRPAELTSLRITDAAISSSQMGDPGKPGTKMLNTFLKNYGLIPRYLRKIGAVYGVVVHEAKNMAHAYTIAGECLRHDSRNHTSPVQNYVVVNYRKIGQSPDQARPFRIYYKD